VGQIEARLNIDKTSFALGMINCFVEMVACGVKRLAISPPLAPELYDLVRDSSEEIVQGFGIKSYLEKSLLITALQSEEFTKNKWAILYYKDDQTLDAYLELKRKRHELEAAGEFSNEANREVSRAFMRLLSYPDDVIETRLSQDRPSDPLLLT
jgi:hypothetical protein